MTHEFTYPGVGYIHVRPGQTYTKDLGLTGSPAAKGGYTVAYILDGAVVSFARARCNAKDAYNRRLGREMARQRLLEFGGKRIALEGRTAPEAILALYHGKL